ncbi:MAG: cytochrome c [Massilia sp.]|nr:cytochrome c [Massilia sp.]
MKPIRTTLRLAALAAAVAAAGMAAAQQAPKPESLIKWRQSAFQVVAWNSGRIKSSLDTGYNKDQVLRSANAIAAIANSGLGSLFAPGSETGKGWHDTSAKPELFANSAKFAELGGEFGKESSELVRVVSSGADAAAVKDQFGKLQRTCKSCHDEFRNAKRP